MGRILQAFRAGLHGKDADLGEVFVVAEKTVQCQHCGADRFVEGRAQLNTAGMTFFNLDWANRTAATLTCVRCGRIEWFLGDPETVAEARRP
jgi:predicted nucleic-acid-binding Zn-ribbon protein